MFTVVCGQCLGKSTSARTLTNLLQSAAIQTPVITPSSLGVHPQGAAGFNEAWDPVFEGGVFQDYSGLLPESDSLVLGTTDGSSYTIPFISQWIKTTSPFIYYDQLSCSETASTKQEEGRRLRYSPRSSEAASQLNSREHRIYIKLRCAEFCRP